MKYESFYPTTLAETAKAIRKLAQEFTDIPDYTNLRIEEAELEAKIIDLETTVIDLNEGLQKIPASNPLSGSHQEKIKSLYLEVKKLSAEREKTHAASLKLAGTALEIERARMLEFHNRAVEIEKGLVSPGPHPEN